MAAARCPASGDKTLKLWDLETGNPLATFTADSDFFAVAVAANDRFVAGSHDGRLSILRLLT
jgi:WD40 repeat protein